MSSFLAVGEIGRGAFAIVYLVKNDENDELYALKRVDLSKATPAGIKQAEREVDVMKKLEHRHVLEYYGSMYEDTNLDILTEYCPGRDLAYFLRGSDGRLPEDLIVCWTYQITSALKYMHSQRILHRDLKPSNIFLDEEANIKVGDMGVARMLNPDSDLARTFVGSPCYMSPDVFRMKPYTSKTDVWSLGCIVYELTERNRVFDAPSFPLLIQKVLTNEVPPINGNYSSSLRELVALMMSKEPTARPSAGSILDTSPVKDFSLQQKKPLDMISKFETEWTPESSLSSLDRTLTSTGSSAASSCGTSSTELRFSISKEFLKKGRRRKLSSASSVSDENEASGYSCLESSGSPKFKESFPKPEGEGQRVISFLIDSLLLARQRLSQAKSSSDSDSTLIGNAASAESFLLENIQMLQSGLVQSLGEDKVRSVFDVMRRSDLDNVEANLKKTLGDEYYRKYKEDFTYLNTLEAALEDLSTQDSFS